MDSYGLDEMKKELLRDEGFRSAAYQDHLGYLTIGIGRLIDKRRGGGITRDEAAYLLGSDIAQIEAALDARIPWWRDANPRQQRSLLNMAFQMGVGGLMKFRRTLALAERGDWNQAATNALKSRWARQTPARARRVAALMRVPDKEG